jgi:hypothetical protein
VIARIAALDIANAELVCCVRLPGAGPATRRVQEVRTYSTMTSSLLGLADRLRGLGVTRVVMEATSDYWKPPFYLLEAAGLPGVAGQRQRCQAPAGPTQNRPGWTRSGCASSPNGKCSRPSFVPPAPVRILRDLTRYRWDLVATRTAEKQRVEKLLEDAQIKLSVVATDIFGASGRGNDGRVSQRPT